MKKGIAFFCFTVGGISVNEIVWILILYYLPIVVVYGCFPLFSLHFVIYYFYGLAITFMPLSFLLILIISSLIVYSLKSHCRMFYVNNFFIGGLVLPDKF